MVSTKTRQHLTKLSNQKTFVRLVLSAKQTLNLCFSPVVWVNRVFITGL